jgi:hypothetical protein
MDNKGKRLNYMIKKLDKLKIKIEEYYKQKEKKEETFFKHYLMPTSINLNERLMELIKTGNGDKLDLTTTIEIDNMIEAAMLYPKLYEGREDDYKLLLLMKTM